MELKDTFPAPLNASCKQCKRPLVIRLHGLSRFVVCHGCGHAMHRDTATGYLTERRTYSSRKFDPYLEPGDEGELFGRRYLVTGWVRKKEKGASYSWVEYHLFNPVHGFAQLSVYEGHWTFHEQLKVYPRASGIEDILLYERNAYQKYNAYSCTVTEAAGEFSRDVNDDQRAKVKELIAPPYMLTREQDPDELAWYLGQYVEPDDLRKAFGKSRMPPPRHGVGAAQPMRLAIDKNILRTISIATVAVFIITQLFFWTFDAQYTIASHGLQVRMDGAPGAQALETPSFELRSPYEAVELMVFPVGLENTWFSLSGALINEHTGETRSFDMDIEYYSGYEGGERWAEGSKNEGIVFSAMPAGTYHLELYPAFDSARPVTMFSVELSGSPTLWSNMWLLLFLAMAFPLITWYRVQKFETNRWGE